MRRDTNAFELGHQVGGNAVVQNALAGDDGFLFGVKGCSVVLEILDKRSGFGAFIDNFGFAFVDFFLRAMGTSIPNMLWGFQFYRSFRVITMDFRVFEC